YAACIYQQVQAVGFGSPPFRDATSRLGDLPLAVQALLHARRTYTAGGGPSPDALHPHFHPPSEGCAPTPEEARALNPHYANQAVEVATIQLIPASSDEGAVGLKVSPVLPHGAIFGWGG